MSGLSPIPVAICLISLNRNTARQNWRINSRSCIDMTSSIPISRSHLADLQSHARSARRFIEMASTRTNHHSAMLIIDPVRQFPDTNGEPSVEQLKCEGSTLNDYSVRYMSLPHLQSAQHYTMDSLGGQTDLQQRHRTQVTSQAFQYCSKKGTLQQVTPGYSGNDGD